MELSKENVFRTNYAPIVGENMSKRKRWTDSVTRFIHNNKIITMIFITFFMCVVLNMILIYNFIKILESAY